MVRCPRCDGEVEQLHPVPAGLLGIDAADDADEVCQSCLNEIREG